MLKYHRVTQSYIMEEITMDKWIKQFENPSAEYRPHPFWSWNDKLDEAELRRQIKMLAQTGHGGFYMHARSGIETQYLGDEWFDLVKACADEAKKQGIEAWCYDENGWPSGSANGTIQKMKYENQQFALKCLPYQKGEELNINGDILGYYGVNPDMTYERIFADDIESAYNAKKDTQTLYYAAALIVKGYVDLLNPAVVKDFIDSTHEKYAQKLKTQFEDSSLYGFFTDEPQYTLCKTPWTTIAQKEFENRYGYDVLDHIPALFIGTPNKEAVRYDYWKMISDLYCKSFMKQIQDWCDDNGTKLTGHVMMEDNLLCQIHCTAGAMPAYEYMHIPGIDWLGSCVPGSKVDSREGVPTIPLQVGSVAAQLGKKHVLTETYAMCGWNISFAELRHLADWQYLSGVNYMCQHLAGYSMRGSRKNDFPPSMFYQSPFWKDYNVFTDTLSRMGKIFADAKDTADVLMIHPMHSVWIKYTNDALCAEEVFDSEFLETSLKLYEYHVPYHYGDETLMKKYGKVENGKLIIGNCSYSTVFIPYLYGLDRNTYDLLNEFADQGGRLAVICDENKIPEFIDGRYAKDELNNFFSKADKANIYNEEVFLKYLSDNGLNRVTVSDRNGVASKIHYSCRAYENDDKRVYFFVNMDRYNSKRVKITLDEENAAELLVDSMKFVSHPTVRRDGKLEMDVIFEPMESHLFISGKDVEDAPLAIRYTEHVDTVLSNEWKLSKKSDPNCLLLEYCSVLNDDGTWSDPYHIFRCVDPATSPKARKLAPALKFEVSISDTTNLTELNDVKVVSEFGSPVTFTVNGTKVERIPDEWWFDHKFNVHGIGDHLKKGVNEIIVTDFCNETEEENGKSYHNRAEFGNMYLVGNFGVYSNKPYIEALNRTLYTDGQFTVTNRPENFVGGEIVRQGHPFFRGTIVIEQDINIDNTDIERHIKLSQPPYAAYAYISINGVKSDILAWNDNSFNITPYIQKGNNHIEIELTIGNRNLLGPHHYKTLGQIECGPEDFYPFYMSQWKYRYSFMKAGLCD